MIFLFLTGTRRGCNPSDHLITSLWEYYALIIQRIRMEIHTSVAQARANLMAYIVLFLLGSQTHSQKYFSLLTLPTGSRARNTLVQSNRLTLLFHSKILSRTELFCSVQPHRTQRAMQLRLSQQPLHSMCTHSSWPKYQ